MQTTAAIEKNGLEGRRAGGVGGRNVTSVMLKLLVELS